MLDHGGLRRATLRGCEKLTKHHMAAAMTYKLSLLMRTLFGIGTPKQAMAGARKRLFAAFQTVSRIVLRLLWLICHWLRFPDFPFAGSRYLRSFSLPAAI